jgi:sulfoxide reductase catalytic subunit YedY
LLIRIRSASDEPQSAITAESLYLRRREFLHGAGVAAGALAGGALLAGCGPAENAGAETPAEPELAQLPSVRNAAASTDEEPTRYEDATRYNNFYEFGTEKTDPSKHAHRLVTRPWSVEISGEVAKPGLVPLEDLLRPHPLEERVYRLRCVEAWSMVIPWIGLPLGDLLKRFEPTSRAKFVEFKTLLAPEQMPGQRRAILDWPYMEGLRIDEAMNPLAILAVGMYGRVLPNQNGAPLRLVVPWKYGFKSIKSIVSMVDHPRWSQKRERRIGEFRKRPTLPFNGYAEQVASLYAGMDPKKLF